MTHNKSQKHAIREEAKRRDLPYQNVLQERWRPCDSDGLRVRLHAVIADVCRGRLPCSGPADDGRAGELVADLLRVAIDPPFRYFGPAREQVVGAEIGPEKTEACMHLVSHFVMNREVQPVDWEELTRDLTLAVAPIVCRQCPGHKAASDRRAVGEATALWLNADDGDFEKLTDDD